MENETSLQRSSAILDTYDPEWEIRWDKINKQLAVTSQQLQDAHRADMPLSGLAYQQTRLLSELHTAFYAQFRTAEEYRLWSEARLVETAQTERKVLILPELPEDASIADIRQRTAHAYDMLNEQSVRTLPVGQPEGLDGFGVEPQPGTRRTTFYLRSHEKGDYPSETRCTIDQTGDKAFVCFHHLPDTNGLSPTNGIASLATGAKHIFLPHIKPQNIKFFIHVPVAAGGMAFGETFSRVDMEWVGARYTDPRWNYFDVIPAAIREAELKPYDAHPLSQEPEIPITSSNLGTARGRLLHLAQRLCGIAPKQGG